ncbi:hypothetical protein [Sphingopyxis sp.]|uniref:hypothetical protein n=1 Tax=Sphingopyxis sp. TaxID=1908224 RepID=UPI002D7973CB|nr:hypothetical protein [Sphingopyxis sp.]HET6523574.1 hypothetical protein [Sphingopyxis sp.]
MRVAVFILLLAVALGYSVWRGGGPERTMAGIAFGMVASDQLLHLFVPPDYLSTDLGHLAIDLAGASATFTLALFAYRFWPMFAAVLHILPLLAHTSRTLDVSMDPAAYMIMQVAPSWAVPLLLIAATWQHRTRLGRSGSDPSWRSF